MALLFPFPLFLLRLYEVELEKQVELFELNYFVIISSFNLINTQARMSCPEFSDFLCLNFYILWN